MSAEAFIAYGEGADVATAFRAAVAAAQGEHGNSGHTGTVADKDDYIVIDGGPHSEEEAEALAETSFSDLEERGGDRWGPAGAIGVCAPYRELCDLLVPSRVDGYPDVRTAALAAADGKLVKGEVVTSATLVGHRVRRDGGIDVDTNTTATVTTRGATEVTGWLFFGWAPR